MDERFDVTEMLISSGPVTGIRGRGNEHLHRPSNLTSSVVNARRTRPAVASQGTLRSGRSGKKVTSRKQAIAIGLSEARAAGAKVPSRGRSSRKK